MDDVQLERRVRVIVVTTRAASSSLGDDGKAAAAILRGLGLLAALDAEVPASVGQAILDQMESGRAELASMLEDRST